MAVTMNNASGQLSDSTTTLYTASSVTASTLSISLNNTSGATVNATLYLNDGSDRAIVSVDIAAGDTALVDTRYVITDAQSIRGIAATTNVIDYWISLLEEA